MIGVDLHAVAAAAVEAQTLALLSGLSAFGVEGDADAVGTAVGIHMVGVAGVEVHGDGEVVIAAHLVEPQRAALPGLFLGEDVVALGFVVVGVSYDGDVALGDGACRDRAQQEDGQQGAQREQHAVFDSDLFHKFSPFARFSPGMGIYVKDTMGVGLLSRKQGAE